MLLILVLSATLGVIGIDGYLTHAKQAARDSVARTIFMAAQTSLTHEYNQDRDFYKRTFPFVPDRTDTSPHFLPAGEPEKQTDPYPEVVYLTYAPGEKTTQPLYAMLAPYINDKSILDDTILIEFNRATGMMLSAFYTEVEDVQSFGYGTGDYNVKEREADYLIEREVGFYGVDSTGEDIRGVPIDEKYSLLLKDYTDYRQAMYGLLTAEITLPEKGVADNLLYTLMLSSDVGSNESVAFGSSKGMADVAFTIEDLANRNIKDVDAAMQNLISRGDKKCIAYLNGNKLVIVLDCVQSFGAAENLGILANYPNLKGGMLTATLDIFDGTETTTIFSEENPDSTLVHTLYDGGSTPAENRMVVTSVRHLHNIRYTADVKTFVQTSDVYLWRYVGGRKQTLRFTPLCNARDAAEDVDAGFAGKYTVNGDYAIYDLAVDLTEQDVPESGSDSDVLYNAGLFDTIRPGASVKGVRLSASDASLIGSVPRKLRVLTMAGDTTVADAVVSVKGLKNAGGIAGVNNGTIENCTAIGHIVATGVGGSDASAAGGIAGRNGGAITKCYTAATVEGDAFAGGVAGRSTNDIAYCETGTASWRTYAGEGSEFRYISGTAAFGAQASAARYEPGNNTANNTFRVVINESGGKAGGIVGELAGANAQITGCVNACKVEAGNEASGSGAPSGGLAGGIVGHVAAENTYGNHNVWYCYNAGGVYATDCAGGLVGRLTSGEVGNCYNTGVVNLEGESVSVNDVSYYMPGERRNLPDDDDTPAYAGGLAGHLATGDVLIHHCYSAQYAGTRYGGAFGVVDAQVHWRMYLDNDCGIRNCFLLKNLYNDSKEYYVDYLLSSGGIQRTKADEWRIRYQSKVTLLDNRSTFRSLSGDSAALIGMFNPGSLVGTGPFLYTYPTLISPDYTGDNIHRTPWRQAEYSFGDIDAEESAAGHIEVAFELTPPEGKIVLIVREEDDNKVRSEFAITIPLTRANFIDLHANVGKFLHIDGEAGDKSYSFYIKAERNTAEKVADGVPYKYTLYINYRTDNFSDRLPNDTYELEAQLFNKYYRDGGEYCAHDTLKLRNKLFLTNVTASDGTKGVELEMRVDRDNGNDDLTIEFTFLDANNARRDSRRVYIRNNVLNGLPKTFDSAIANAPVAGFDRGETQNRFCLYATGGNKSATIHLVLWYGEETDPYCKPNGFTNGLVHMPVDVQVVNGVGTANTYVRHFNSLESATSDGTEATP